MTFRYLVQPRPGDSNQGYDISSDRYTRPENGITKIQDPRLKVQYDGRIVTLWKFDNKRIVPTYPTSSSVVIN
jgi:hypothetical protein